MPRRILSRLFFLVGALSLAACGNGGGGDPPSTPPANALGNGTPLTAVLGPATWEEPGNPDSTNCKYPADVRFAASGLTVSAIDTFDETGTGSIGNYYIQDTVDDPPAYSGITVFGPSFSPPDLRLANNDVVDFLGSKSEFGGPSTFLFPDCQTLPELAGTLTFRFDGVKQLAPKTIKIDDVLTYDAARPWLGMLVRIEEVDLLAPKSSCSNLPSGCRYTATIFLADHQDLPTVGNQFYDIKNQGPNLTPQGGDFKTHFHAITGVLTYFQQPQLDPRSPQDFEP